MDGMNDTNDKNYLRNFTIGTLFILNSIGSEKKNHTCAKKFNSNQKKNYDASEID